MEDIKESVIFPLGELISDGTTKGFTGGKVYSYMFIPFESEYNCPLGNVTYAPCARNCWHIHPGGQVLLITGGRGWYQEEGSPAHELKAGDCVLVPPGVKHWHGASKDSFMSHIGLITNTDKGLSKSYGHVSDEEYNKLP